MFLNQTATTEIYTLSLHDALPIWPRVVGVPLPLSRAADARARRARALVPAPQRDRKSTRLNSSHVKISYAVFCLKKKISAVSSCLFLNHSTVSGSIFSLFFMSGRV